MDPRLTRLTRQFNDLVHGKLKPTRFTSPIILESIYSQPEPVTCVHKLVASESGLACLQAAIFVNLAPSFLNTHPAQLILFLGAPSLKDVGGGHYIRQIVKKLVDPPIFWQALTQAFADGQLQDDGQRAFGWLLLQLVTFPADDAQPYREFARQEEIPQKLISSTNIEVRGLGHKLKHIVEIVVNPAGESDYGPGGRHDNDHVEFRKIDVMPTADEITSKEPAFMRTAAEVDNTAAEQRFATHLDNQFRLYREDMLHELREELQIALGQRKGRHRGLVIDNLTLVDMYGVTGGRSRNDHWGIVLSMLPEEDLWFFRRDKPKDRKKYLMDDRKLIKDGSMAALIIDGTVVSFPTIRRDEDRLSKKPPEFALLLNGKQSTIVTLSKFVSAKSVKLVQIDTAVFSYEPVLKALQQITLMPLATELTQGKSLETPPNSPTSIIDALRQNPSQDLKDLIHCPKSIILDDAQARSLLSGLTQRMAIIQGPPGIWLCLQSNGMLNFGSVGTGKSFVGALLAKIFHDHTDQKILVCCYTNHALDQFLEDLLDIGIPPDSIVRMGGKSTNRTDPLSLYRQKMNTLFGRTDWAEINTTRDNATNSLTRLQRDFSSYMELTRRRSLRASELMDYLEFADAEYHYAFTVPGTTDDGMKRVGKGGRGVAPIYLIERWLSGQNAGVLQDAENVLETSSVWGMPMDERRERIKEWKDTIIKECVERLYDLGKAFNGFQDQLTVKYAQNETLTLLSKRVRIIGCTTTAAAKYTQQLRDALPEVLLVEEAGEILESHVLTALGEETRRLILIGDHK